MATKGSLMVHRGAKLIDLEALKEKESSEEWRHWTEDDRSTYLHIPYSTILETFVRKARSMGFPCPDYSLGVTDSGSRFFGVVNLEKKDEAKDKNEELGLIMGLRSSHEGSFAVQVNLGSRVFVCDNLMFNASGLIKNIVKAKHHGRADKGDFGLGMDSMVELQLAAMADSLLSVADVYKKKAQESVIWMKDNLLEDDEAKLLLWKLRDSGALADGEMPKTFDVWKAPAFEAFQEHADTLWGLYNAVTSPDILGKKPLHQQGDAHLKINESGLFLPPLPDNAEVSSSEKTSKTVTAVAVAEKATEGEEEGGTEDEEFDLPM